MRFPRRIRQEDKVTVGVVLFILLSVGALYLALVISK